LATDDQEQDPLLLR